MDIVDINKELINCINNLRNASNKIFDLAREKAEAEKNYRKALQTEIVQLKDEKLAATLIPDVARGKTSELKFERDLAEARYISARDYLDAHKAAISAYQSILRYQEDV